MILSVEQQAQLRQAQSTIAKIYARHPAPWHYIPHEATIYMIDAAGTSVELFDILDISTAHSTVIALNAIAATPSAQPEATPA